MIANIYIPLWPFGVAFIALCFAPDVVRWVRKCCMAVQRAGVTVGAHRASMGRRPFDQAADGFGDAA